MRDQLRALGNRVQMMIGRGVMRGVTDSAGRQTLQVEMLKDELRDGVERMQSYGFTSHPTGGDVVVAFVGGNRDHGIILAVDDRRYRITAMQSGEVAMYDDLGNRVMLLRDMVKVVAVQHLEAEAPTTKIVSAVTIEGTLTVNGNVETTGTLKNNGKNVGSTHTHSGVTAGPGNTGAPN